MYGRKPRCSSLDSDSRTAIAKPTVAPSTKPAAASLAVKAAASSSTLISRGPFRREGSKSWPNMSCTCGIVRSLTGNGCVSPTRSPNHLYASQSRQETMNTSAVRPTFRSAFRSASPRGSTTGGRATAALDTGSAYHTGPGGDMSGRRG